MFAIVFAFGFLPQVVLFLGQMLVSDDGALRYARDNAEVLWQVPVAVSVLAMYYARDRRRHLVAHLAPDHRRRDDHRPAPHLRHREHHPRRGAGETSSDQSSVSAGPPETIITEDGDVIVVPSGDEPVFGDDFEEIDHDPSAAGLFNLLTLPLVVRDLVFLGEVEGTNALSGIDNGGLYARAGVRGRADRRASWSSSGATTRSSVDGTRHRSARASAPAARGTRSRVRRRCDGGGERRVGVVRPEGRAVGAELQLRRRRHRPARSQRRRQDHVDARHHRPHPRQPGHRGGRRPLAPSGPIGVRAAGPRARGRSGASWPVTPAALHLRGRPARHHRPPDHRLGDRDRADGVGRRPEHGRLQQGDAPAQQGRRGPREEPARAGARRAPQRRRPRPTTAPDRAVPAPGR